MATIVDDYGIVRELVADLIAEGAERTVSTAVRETVEAAKTLLDDAEYERGVRHGSRAGVEDGLQRGLSTRPPSD